MPHVLELSRYHQRLLSDLSIPWHLRLGRCKNAAGMPLEIIFLPLNLGTVRRTASILMTVAIGILLSGGGLGFLQSLAWTGMILSRAPSSSLHAALQTTFDGQHPCPLCRLIQEQKHQVIPTAPARQDLTLVIVKMAIVPVFVGQDEGSSLQGLALRSDDPHILVGVVMSPPVPPPRS
jgi:hypothetical protein